MRSLVLCQVLELGLCATGFASAGRQYTMLMYTGTASGTPKLKLDTALVPIIGPKMSQTPLVNCYRTGNQLEVQHTRATLDQARNNLIATTYFSLLG